MQLIHSNTQNKKNSKEIILAIESLERPENIGSLFRLADAMGITKIYLGFKLDFKSRKIKKTSRSTIPFLNIKDQVDCLEIVQEYQAKGFYATALELTSTSKSLQQKSFKQEDKVILTCGNESKGVSPELLAQIENHYHIDMYGENSSMNVISALSMALYHVNNV